MVAWPKVCMPMPLGGLGVVNLDFFSKGTNNKMDLVQLV